MRIICATDFSEAARAAVDLSAALASKLGDTIQLVHIVELPPVLGEDVPPGDSSWESSLRETGERELAKAKADLEARGLTTDTVVRVGPTADQIRDLAAAAEVRLVVLGSHGRKGAAHFFLGSVAEEVARLSPCPVLVTRGLPYPADGLTGQRPLHLLVVADGTPAAESALGWVKGLRGIIPCDITLVQSCWPPAEAERFGLEQAWAERQIHPTLLPLLDRELRRWAGLIPGEGEVRCRFVASHGRLGEDLAAEAELVLPDLIVVGTSRRSFGGASSLTPLSVLRNLKMPVVCVPASLRPPAENGIPLVATVLVGTDLSAFANQTIPAAYSLLRGTGGTVEICYVYERGSGTESAMDLPAESPPVPSLKDEIEGKLARLVPTEAASLGITSQVHVVEALTVADGLMHEAERIGADVLVIASHGHTGWKRALLGSVAETIVRKGTRPVLVLYPRLR